MKQNKYKYLLLFIFFSVGINAQNKIDLADNIQFIEDDYSINNDDLYGEFIFDTGSTVTILDKKIVDYLQLKTERGSKKTFTYYGTKSLKKIKLDFFKLGDLELQNQEFYVADLSFLSQNKQISGIIGTDIIKKLNWKIDYRKKHILFSDKKFDTKNFQSFPIKFRGRKIFNQYKSPYVQLKINNKKFNLLVDSGSDAQIALKKYEDNWVIGENIHYFDKPEYEKYLKLNFQEILFKGVASQKMIPSIGTGFLKRFHQVIIPKGFEFIYLQKNVETENKPFFKFGFTLEIKNGIYTVVSLYKNSEAEKTGLKLGDKILKINDLELKNSSSQNIVKEFEKQKLIVLKMNGQKMILDLE